MGNIYIKSSKKKGIKMINIIICITCCGLVVAVAHLKSKLNIAESRLDNWRQLALNVNKIVRK